MVRYCENTTPVLKIYSAECFGSFRAAAIATRSKPCTHGPSRPSACIIMLELCAASLWTDALLQHAPIAPPKQQVLLEFCARCARGPSAPRALATCASSRSRTDDESAQRCDPQQALGTAASAMLIAVFGKSASRSKLEKGTRRTASLPAWAMRSAHCPLRPGHCPLHQRIVRMRITPPQGARRQCKAGAASRSTPARCGWTS